MFKKTTLVAALFVVSTSAAFAQVAYMPGTAGNNNIVTQNSNSAAGGAGGQGGTGGKAEQGQLQGQGQLQTSNSGGNKLSTGSNTANNASTGNTTNVSGGNTQVESSAPAVMIGTVLQPIGTCRLSVGGGGSNTSGAFAGGFPIGNDMTCLVDARDKMMQRLPTVFTELDRTFNACMLEGMSEFPKCKEAKAKMAELTTNKSE